MPHSRFDFFSVPRIVFGRGTLATLPELTGQLGAVVLVVYKGGEGPLERVSAALRTTGVRLVPFRQKGEPTVADVDAAIELARRETCTGAIGVGGGSAIDLAKATAGVLGNGGSVLDYMEVIGRGQKIARLALPWVAIPTTAGTGAEVTRNAVVGDPGKKFKASLRGEKLLPVAALIDPELGVDVPPAATAYSGADALCQCVEAYTSNGANDLTDGLALRGVRLAAGSLRAVVANGKDLDAREAMASAALIGGIALTNAGLGAVHGFAAPLGANFAAPHGAICAALMPPVIEANVAAADAAGNRALLARYADIGRAMTGDAFLPDDRAVAAAIDSVRCLVADLAIPPLKTFGMTPADVPAMVALARKASSMRFNPVALSDEVLANVLTRAIG